MLMDPALVERCRNGDSKAFALIVEKYQTLICSVAYSMTGSYSASEELAQETFVTAWQSIADLREPDRLRQWLCGIVRNLANQFIRRQTRDLTRNTEAFEFSQLVDGGKCDPLEQSIVREEAELVDLALKAIPESYREPLVLFYREQQSVARVAELLDLAEGTVKQRLSRGRNMLRAEVAAIVERGLLQSAPGRAFTVGVIASLPIMSGTAKAATLTAVSAKGFGVGTMNSAASLGLLGAIAGPLLGLLGAWFGYSMSLQSARSDRERSFVKMSTIAMFAAVVVFCVAISIPIAFGQRLLKFHAGAFVLAILVPTIGYVIVTVLLSFYYNREIAKIRREDGTDGPMSGDIATGSLPLGCNLWQSRIYDSPTKLFGLPLLSICFHGLGASTDSARRRSAVGWVAIGDRAYGILFASGSFAVGGISTGAVSVGLISFGGLSIGALALGGAALGLFAMGGLVGGYLVVGGMGLGYMAFGGIVFGWKAAFGGIAIAREISLGGMASAPHANDEVARAFVADSRFFQLGEVVATPWFGLVIAAIALLPSVIVIAIVRRR